MRRIPFHQLCKRNGLRIALFFTLSLPMPAMAAEQWFSVLLDGNKVGYATTQHSESAQLTLDSSHTVIDLKGAGRANQLDIELNFESDPHGNPLSFSTHVRTRDIDRLQRGSIDAETVLLRSTYSGIEQREHITVTRDTVWPMQELQLIKTAVAQGNRQLQFKAFDAMLGSSLPVELKIDADTKVTGHDLPQILHVTRTVHYSDHVAITSTDFDATYQPQRISTEISGLQMQLVAVTREQAMAPNQALDYLNRLLVRSPFRISHEATTQHIRYTLALRDGAPLDPPQTGEQRVRHDAAGTTVDVCNQCGNEAREDKPAPETLQPNPWMQSDATEIRTIAERVGTNSDPRKRMRALTDYVREHMRGRSEFLGYVSALEAIKTGNGDCTAYALLLAALGRATGVPTRVAVGMVYDPRFNNRNDVFAPHAWAQAWIGGHWESFDAATEGFDSTHIALAIGQGDPSRFSTAMGTLAKMEMRAAAQVATKFATQK
ncbi:transglutaminase domain-containing protein [Pseudolysobacter antarcticus]|uniref:Transglutaminase domain-containing protein n=1 Tax=Pseudolysobacter antarcticus TaxID=2511995 RepID=A0A411HKC4_9GAMM|nr:transglutaminase-like domain-containing protein [Pseudolysobacter antarcticus]QBB70986.1 transglutaminase domain-containing protein [Pseudolysobacter antarcticus]